MTPRRARGTSTKAGREMEAEEREMHHAHFLANWNRHLKTCTGDLLMPAAQWNKNLCNYSSPCDYSLGLLLVCATHQLLRSTVENPTVAQIL